MPILYSVTAHEKNILAEFASCDGNFIEITQQMLSKIPITDDKMTYFHGTYLIHYIVENKHTFMCITDKVSQLFVPYKHKVVKINKVLSRCDANGDATKGE